MAEAIAISIATSLLTKLGTAAFNEICLAYGVEDELGKLKDTLSTIGAALLDADERKEKSHLMQDWIRKLNDAVYDADDLLDAFSTKALQRDELKNVDARMKMQVCEFFSSSNQLAFRYKMGRKIKEIRDRFDEIAANMSKYNFTERMFVVQVSVNNNRDRETDSFILASEVTGREKDKEEIIKLMMGSSNKEENISVIPIIGIGGLGKTTLTQLVYGDERVVKHFELRLWVCVSEDFEKKTLVRKMLESLTKKEVENLELDQLQICLREKLDGKRYLLILDDVWNERYEKWVSVKNLLMCGAKGGKIVVTTRSETVASVMATENPYMLKGLTEDESWTLFGKVAFRGHETVHPNLVVIAKEIIERCKGVPLAIRSLASVMQSKTQESEWLSIQNSDIWSLCQDGSHIIPILKLSYDHLPIHLRQCFAYCSIFPKDHRIEKEMLIQLWMAQNYVQSFNGSQCLEDIGDQYFSNLLSRSFFQEIEVDDYNKVVSCKMHDLIHDLATRVAGSDCSIVESNDNNIAVRVHHVSLVYDFEELSGQLLKAKGLRTFLHLYDSYWCSFDLRKLGMLTNFRCLRVLDMHGFGIDNVPSSIDKLQHLRYLDLSENKMTNLPNSISKLINLQTLKLIGCWPLQTLPKGITKLIRLRYIMIDSCGKLNRMPTGMGKLILLRRLKRFEVGGDKSSLQLSELNSLNELRGDISIEGLENVRDDVRSESRAANLIAKQYLHSLTLKWGREKEEEGSKVEDVEILLEGLQPHPELRELKIKGYSGRMFPSWMMMDNIMVIWLPNIVRITLEDCDRCQYLPPSLYQLPLLKFLKLRSLRRVEFISDNNLYLAKKSSPPLSSTIFFPSLEELVIEYLPNLKGWWRRAAGTSSSITEEEEEEESSVLLLSQLPSFPRLIRLNISQCPELTSMLVHIPHLEVLTLNFVFRKLLRQLLLLTTTAVTTTATTEGSSSIPSSFSPPLSKLRSLSIYNIDDLEYLPKEMFQNLNSLDHLNIHLCHNLSRVAVTEQTGFRGLSSLRTLTFFRCNRLASLSIQHLNALQHLSITRCDNLVLLDGLQDVATLQHLQIEYCYGLTALPDWISNFNSLQMLQIFCCGSLSERCRGEIGKDWPSISHIPKIIIDGKEIQRTD